MRRYIIKHKETGMFLKRTKSCGMHNEWVAKVDDATLITTASAASQIATRFCGSGQSYRQYRAHYANYPVTVIAVDVLLFLPGTQPFLTGI